MCVLVSAVTHSYISDTREYFIIADKLCTKIAFWTECKCKCGSMHGSAWKYGLMQRCASECGGMCVLVSAVTHSYIARDYFIIQINLAQSLLYCYWLYPYLSCIVNQWSLMLMM